jgi:hypothetical protein
VLNLTFFRTFLVKLFNSQKVKTHDLRHFERGIDYFVDFDESGKSATITTALAIKRGDKIILSYKDQALIYCVRDLERYWNDDSIQTILLEKI